LACGRPRFAVATFAAARCRATVELLLLLLWFLLLGRLPRRVGVSMARRSSFNSASTDLARRDDFVRCLRDDDDDDDVWQQRVQVFAQNTHQQDGGMAAYTLMLLLLLLVVVQQPLMHIGQTWQEVLHISSEDVLDCTSASMRLTNAHDEQTCAAHPT